MDTMLKRENVQFVDSVADWREAIHVATQPLIDQNFITEAYVDAIFENTQKFGPYYVLCENFALLHAGHDRGVVGKQLAVTVLKKPIKFKPDGVDVRILVTLVATDNESHIDTIRSIGKIFSDPVAIRSILDANSELDVYNIFAEAQKS